MSYLKQKYTQFLDTIIKVNSVWVLKSAEGYLQVASDRFAEVPVIPFFSDQAHASVVASSLDDEYVPEQLSLAECIEDWWPSMEADNVWVGVDFDEALEGLEIEAWQVLDDVLSRLPVDRDH